MQARSCVQHCQGAYKDSRQAVQDGQMLAVQIEHELYLTEGCTGKQHPARACLSTRTCQQHEHQTRHRCAAQIPAMLSTYTLAVPLVHSKVGNWAYKSCVCAFMCLSIRFVGAPPSGPPRPLAAAALDCLAPQQECEQPRYICMYMNKRMHLVLSEDCAPLHGPHQLACCVGRQCDTARRPLCPQVR